MRTLYRKKAIALYETRLRPAFVVMTIAFYVLAMILWYALCAITPYMPRIGVRESENKFLTREALSATTEQIIQSPGKKDRALLMPTSESSFCRRLRLIEDAKSSIDFMVYDSYEQHFTEYFYTALVRAADRGVRVRVVLDGKMGTLDKSLKPLEKMLASHDNAELYYFNPVNIWQPRGLMVLMHDKVTIVDGKILIVGGVNMGEAAYLHNYDMEVMVRSMSEHGAAFQATTYFESLISNKLSKRIKSKNYDKAKKAVYEARYTEYFENCEFAKTEIDYDKIGVPVDRVTFLTNKISDDKKAPTIWQTVCNFMDTSEKTIAVTPYTLLEGDKRKKIRDMAAKNKEFILVTNSLYNTRNVAYADYYYNRTEYIRDYIKLYEYQADDQLHAKMFAFDDRYSMIGSFNLDERSAHIDTESVVVIDSPAFNKILTEYIRSAFIENSLEVGQNNEYLPSDTVPSHAVPQSKRFKYWLYSAFALVRCVI